MLIFIKSWSTDSVQKWKKVILAKYLKPKQYHEIGLSWQQKKYWKANMRIKELRAA